MEEENTRDESSRSNTTNTDWIRDWPFDSWDKSEQEHLYNNWKDHWKKIEEKFQISPDWIGYFIYDYVILKNPSSGYRQRRYSESFKKELKELLEIETKENFKSMLQHADFYIDYAFADKPDYNSEFKEHIEKHRNLRSTGYSPAILIMKLRDLLESGKLGEETYKKMLSLLESYRIRLAVKGVPVHWEIFYKMTPLICEKEPLESLLNAMEKMQEEEPKYKIPNDDKFRKKLKKVNFYGGDYLSYDWCRPILYRLENYDRDIQSIPPEQYHQIEHIMPQTIEGTEWESVLGENHKDLHWKWCDRVGNLTLVPSINLNSILSNKSYEDKKKIAKNYTEIANRFQLNDSVWEEEKWTIDEIKKRGKYLADRAVEIWPDRYDKL